MSIQIMKKKIGNSLVEAGTLIKVYSLRLFKEKGFDITPEQFLVLNELVEKGELYQRQLGEALFKDRANVTRITKILEEKELIQKIQDVNKRVVNKICVTKKGFEVHNKVLPVITETREKYLKDIGDSELQICLEVLSKIQENLNPEVKLQL